MKSEISYIKHWDLGESSTFATRYFVGFALPYGNSDNIPFSESFFAGGSNDNRAWEVYRLGPGSSGATDEFNEGNFKIAMNFEYRFKMFGRFNGALFSDIGNIWNLLDDTEDKSRMSVWGWPVYSPRQSRFDSYTLEPLYERVLSILEKNRAVD